MPNSVEEAAVAEEALKRGDLHHAFHHAAGALAGELNNPAWTALVDRVLAAAPHPLAASNPGQTAWYGSAGVFARAHFLYGDPVVAIDIVAQIAKMRPDEDWMAWAASWGPPAALPADGLPAESLWPNLFPYLMEHGTPERAQSVLSLLDWLPKLPRLLWLRSVALRRINKHRDAVVSAMRAFSQDPQREYLISAATAHRSLGEVQDAITLWTQAIAMNPEDTSPYLDIGDTLLEVDRLEEAEAAYEKVLITEPDHEWAAPSALFARWLRSQTEEDFLALTRWVQAHPDSKRARQLLRMDQAAARSTQGAAFLDFLPPPSDAPINALRSVMEQSPELNGGSLQLTSSGAEAPSIHLAWTQLCKRKGWTAKLEIRCDYQKPDPRVPLETFGISLWSFDSDPATPVLKPNVTVLGQKLAEVAALPYDPVAWVQQLQFPEAPDGFFQEIAAWMVNPPEGPADILPWEWVQRFQIACALGMVGAGSGWKGTVRRSLLLGILLGPMDWTVDAAAIALEQIAARDPQAANEIQQAFHLRLQQRPSIGYCCYLWPVVAVWSRMPGVDPSVREQLVEWEKTLHTA